jgi:hypothetical protein
MRRAVLSSAFVGALLLFPGLLQEASPAQPGVRNVFNIIEFDGNLSQRTILLRPDAADISTSITLPDDAQVVNASMELTGLPAPPGGTDHPLDPALDIGADGTLDWAYSGFAYGPMGFQTAFHNDTATYDGLNLSMGTGEKAVLPTRMPANAAIVNASVTLGGWPTPFWRDPVKVTRNGDSPGENSPAFLATDDRLWVAWASKDPNLVGGKDWDIVVAWSADGTAWSAPEDISPPDDLYEDDSPKIIAYGGKIYVAWSAAQNESQFSNSNIFIRAWNGTGWEAALRLTPNDLRRMNDWPQMEVYDGRLFVFWRTTDERLAETSPDGGDMDMVYRTYDGSAWANTLELTPDWDTEIDWSLSLIKFDGKLFAFWDMDTDLTFRGFTVDIFYRAFDGTDWSDPYNIIPQPDIELDEIPKLAVYRNPVTGQDELWACWIRGDPGSHDLDIMVRRYDGKSWGPMTELTRQGEKKDNMGAELLEYDGRLYAVWVTGTNTTEEENGTIRIYNTYGDVIIRAYDGYGWSDFMELTPGEENDNANSPALAVYNGKLYCGWAYPYEPTTPDGTETWDIVVRNIDFRPVELELDAGDRPPADWGPSALGSTNVVVPLYDDAVEGALASLPRFRDAYGNELVDLPVAIRSIYPSSVQVRDLRITYSLTVRLDNISDILNGLIAKAGAGGRSGRNVTIPLLFSANSTGAIRVERLNLTYIINLPPVLVEPVPDRHFPEDSPAPHLIDLEEYFWDDWDDGRLTFTVESESDPLHIKVDVEGRWLSFRPNRSLWHGSGEFRVRATDSGGLWALSNRFNITVDHVNHPPVLEPVPDQRVDTGDLLYFELHATDPDNDTLYFSSDNARFTPSRLEARKNAGYVSYFTTRPGRYTVNITVDDGFGGNDTQMVNIRIRDKVSSNINDLCASWVLIIVVAVAAVVAAEWYRRKYLRETAPVLGPDGEYTEEEVFGGLVATRLGGARLSGGTEKDAASRYSPPEARPKTRSELAAEARRNAEERVAIPETAVAADAAEERKGREAAEAARKGQALLPLVEGGEPKNPPAREGTVDGAGKDPLEELLKNG